MAQLRLSFPSLEPAVAYVERQGLAYEMRKCGWRGEAAGYDRQTAEQANAAMADTVPGI